MLTKSANIESARSYLLSGRKGVSLSQYCLCRSRKVREQSVFQNEKDKRLLPHFFAVGQSLRPICWRANRTSIRAKNSDIHAIVVVSGLQEGDRPRNGHHSHLLTGDIVGTWEVCDRLARWHNPAQPKVFKIRADDIWDRGLQLVSITVIQIDMYSLGLHQLNLLRNIA